MLSSDSNVHSNSYPEKEQLLILFSDLYYKSLFLKCLIPAPSPKPTRIVVCLPAHFHWWEITSAYKSYRVVPRAQKKHRTFESLQCWGNHQWAVWGYFKLVEIHILFLTSKWLEEAGSVLESFLEKKKVRLVFCQGETNFVIFFLLKTSLCMISFEKKEQSFIRLHFVFYTRAFNFLLT